nr:hypothetical protein [Kofleriaceae bacterium]
MRAAVVIALVGAACGGHEERAHRSGSAAPVELVADPVYVDGGAAAQAAGSGAIADEVEPNDNDDVATPLPLGGRARGKLEPADSDVDRYRIEVGSAGELAVFVGDLDGDVTLDIEDASGNLLARSDRGQRSGSRDDAGGAHVREGVPNLGVLPGRYYAVVHGRAKPKPTGKPSRRPAPAAPAGPPVSYRIAAEMRRPDRGAEREPDDDRATATDILVGDHATGYLGWEHDSDVWKLSLEGVAARTALDITVGKPDGVAIELEVGDGIGSAIATRRVGRGVTAIIRGLVPAVPAGGSPFHYLTVKAVAGSNPETGYELAVTAAPVAADGELEPDDSLDHAMPIAAGSTVVHATWTPGDVDYYALPAPASGAATSIDVGLDAPANAGLGLDVLADGKVVASSPAKGAAEHVTAKIPANTRTVVRVRGSDGSPPAGVAYDLQLHSLGT